MGDVYYFQDMFSLILQEIFLLLPIILRKFEYLFKFTHNFTNKKRSPTPIKRGEA
jgi:hypothetical protein